MSTAIYRFSACVVVFSALLTYRVTTAAPSAPTKVQDRDATVSGKSRIREGTTVRDQTGFFRQDGDGATFVTDEGMEFGGLPNLNLERVVRTLKTADDSKSIRWSVSGLITEFSSRNFLLISRAIYKSTPPPPVPEQLSN